MVLWCGWPFLKRGWRSFRTWQLNMFSLIALGVAAPWLFGVAAVLAPEAFPAGFRDHHGQVGVYFEAAAVIVVLVLLGQILDLGARDAPGRQNLFLALFYNATGVPMAADMIYPVLGVLVSPMFAAAAMSLSSVSVIVNALRLRAVRLDG